MYDVLLMAVERAQKQSNILERLGLEESPFLLATVHRAENTDDHNRLGNIMAAFSEIAEREVVVLPLHPRTRKILNENPSLRRTPHPSLKIIEPVGYLDMVRLEQAARIILTDSGGVQKEAYRLSVPCIILRDETEWVKTVEAGWNIVVKSDKERIVQAVFEKYWPTSQEPLFGDGQAAQQIVEALTNHDEK